MEFLKKSASIQDCLLVTGVLIFLADHFRTPAARINFSMAAPASQPSS